MTNRNELALEIFIADNSGQPREEGLRDWAAYSMATAETYAHNIADGLIVAGYRKPRTITDDDGLRAAKAIGTLLRDAEGRVIERVETLPGHLRWYWLSNNITNSVWPYLPATVLYEPTA